MTSHLNSNPVIIPLVVILVTAICFPVLWCQKTRPYDICGQSIRCDHFEFKYPFWGLGRPIYCGHPGFQLTCESNVPVLISESIDYQILYIDSNTQTITVARKDLWGSICPHYLHNTTYDSTLFNGNSFGQENVSLYYGCQDNMHIPVADNYRFTCNVNETQKYGYFYRTSLISTNIEDYLVQCSSYITVPVDRSSADQLASVTASESDLRLALIAGFNLQWKANKDDCDKCIQSTGQCGSNLTSPALFACYCATGNFSLSCDNTKERAGQ